MNNSRHLGIFDPTDHKHSWIHILGCGNIGSHTATALARMGFERFVLYDFDTVDDVNICTQNFSNDDIDKLKIDVVENKMLEINPDIIVYHVSDEITEDSNTFPDVYKEINEEHSLAFISGVDSIEVRAMIKKLLEDSTEFNETPIIDGRIGQEQVELHYARTPNDWNVIISEEESIKTPCTEKYISYTPLLCASFIANAVKKMCGREDIYKETIYDFVTSTFIKNND